MRLLSSRVSNRQMRRACRRTTRVGTCLAIPANLMVIAEYGTPASADEAQHIGVAPRGVAKHGRSQDVRYGLRDVAATSWAIAHGLNP